MAVVEFVIDGINGPSFIELTDSNGKGKFRQGDTFAIKLSTGYKAITKSAQNEFLVTEEEMTDWGGMDPILFKSDAEYPEGYNNVSEEFENHILPYSS